MIRIYLISLFFCLILNANVINYGIVPDNLFTTKKEAGLSLKIWTKEMKKNANININAIIYKDDHELYKDFIAGKIQIASLSARLYFTHKKELLERTQQIFTFSIDSDKNKFIEYYFIKNINSDLYTNSENKKNIYFKKSEDGSRLWLDYILIKENQKNYMQYFEKEVSLKKQASIVYKVFFKKNTFAVVPKVTYETVAELNPQIKRKVKILRKSKAIFVSLVGLINKNMNKNDLEKIKSLTLEKEYEDVRSEAFSISSITSLILLEEKDLLGYEKMAEEYLLMKKERKQNVNATKK